MTSQDIWLAVYTAVIRRGSGALQARRDADQAVEDWREKFMPTEFKPKPGLETK